MSLHPRPLSAWATGLPRAQRTDLESRARIKEQLTAEVVKRKRSRQSSPTALCLAGFDLNDLDVDRCPSKLEMWVPSSLQHPGPANKVFALCIAGAAYGRESSSRTQLACTTVLLDLVTIQIATEQQANICTSSQRLFMEERSNDI